MTDNQARGSSAIESSDSADIIEYLATEAQLLDEQRYPDWLALFTDDGHYWVPTSTEQSEPDKQASLAYEDKLLLGIRIERLAHPNIHSQHPASSSQHVLQASRVINRSATEVVTRTPFIYTESRAGRSAQLTGIASHWLQPSGDSWRIRLKRVDIRGADSPLPMIQLFL